MISRDLCICVLAQPSAPSLFAVEDKNGDGKISWEEFSGPKGTSPDDREKAATPEEVKALNAANAAHASEQVAASNDSAYTHTPACRAVRLR